MQGRSHGNGGLSDSRRQAAQARRPGNVIQGGCLNVTSLGAGQSAARPSSSALAGMVATEVRTVSSPPVNPSTSS